MGSTVAAASPDRDEASPASPTTHSPWSLRRSVVSLWRSLFRTWLSCQVELNGQYSVQRMLAFDAYRAVVHPTRVLQLLFLTFVPCLLVEMMLEAIPLGPLHASRDSVGPLNFWIRTTIGTYIVTHSLVAQYRHNIYDLELSGRQIIGLSIVTTALVMPIFYGAVLAVGFPFPFFVAVAMIPWTPIVATIAAFLLRHQLRRDPKILASIRRYTLVFIAQSFLIVVYPAFSHLFNAYPSAQTPLALLLPVIKLVLKNWFSFASKHIEDLKPELVVFNVDIFSSLYVSSCMQSATSISTTLVIMGVDFLQACMSIKDLNDILNDPTLLQALARANDDEGESRAALPNRYNTQELIPLTMFVLQTNAFVRHHPSIQIRTCVPKSDVPVAVATKTKIAPIEMFESMRVPARVLERKSTEEPVGVLPSTLALFKGEATNRNRSIDNKTDIQPTRPTTAVRLLTSASRLGSVFTRFAQQRVATADQKRLADLMSRLSDEEQLLVVQKTLQILHISEFVALVEYSEVFVPLVYSLFSIIAYTFPNRHAFPAMTGLSDAQFYASLQNVLVYGVLELISFIALDQVMKRKFQVSAFAQTAFVLESQWPMVQSKLTLWMVVALQFAHEFFGNDFTFQFKWLRKSHTA